MYIEAYSTFSKTPKVRLILALEVSVLLRLAKKIPFAMGREQGARRHRVRAERWPTVFLVESLAQLLLFRSKLSCRSQSRPKKAIIYSLEESEIWNRDVESIKNVILKC